MDWRDGSERREGANGGMSGWTDWHLHGGVGLSDDDRVCAHRREREQELHHGEQDEPFVSEVVLHHILSIPGCQKTAQPGVAWRAAEQAEGETKTQTKKKQKVS